MQNQPQENRDIGEIQYDNRQVPYRQDIRKRTVEELSKLTPGQLDNLIRHYFIHRTYGETYVFSSQKTVLKKYANENFTIKRSDANELAAALVKGPGSERFLDAELIPVTTKETEEHGDKTAMKTTTKYPEKDYQTYFNGVKQRLGLKSVVDDKEKTIK